jgi:two-component system, LytTR family, response regulator
MTKLRTLIVDDEPLARERLRSLLGKDDTVEIVGECASGTDAIAKIRGTALDVVFLDMQMPGCDGLQVLKELPEANRPAIVFATAHERFALDAFEVQAVDYLLKPFDRERLQTAVRRVHDYLRAQRIGNIEQKLETLLADAGSPAKKSNERFAVKADGRLVFLKPDDITWVEAADNYVVLHLLSGQLMVRETMSALEARLGAGSFARVNRSAIVHLDQIRELQPTFHGDYVVILRDGTKIPLSRNLRGQLDKLTGQKLG